MTIVGKFVMVDDGDSYRTGRVEQQVGDESFFVRFDHMNEKGVKLPLSLTHTISIVSGNNGEWHFFDTREELNTFLDWLDGPPKGKVVKMVKG